jgi:hypothetical protein
LDRVSPYAHDDLDWSFFLSFLQPSSPRLLLVEMPSPELCTLADTWSSWSTPQVARIRDMSCHVQLVCFLFLSFFCHAGVWTQDLTTCWASALPLHCHSDWGEMGGISVILICIFLMDKDVGRFFVCLLTFFFFIGWVSGLHGYKAGALPLETHLQSILLWLFWRWGFRNYLPGLVLNWDPPDLKPPKH